MGVTISVITAVYNRASTLEQSLESVHAQTWPHIEHVVIDGGSTDGSLAILDRHSNAISTMVSEPDGGLYEALNKGIRASSGDIVGFMHADDHFATSGALAKVGAAFDDPTVAAVYGDLLYVKNDDSGQVVRYWRAGEYRREDLASGWMPPHPTFYVRRDLYARFGVFDTRYRIAADYENMLRMLWQGGVKALYIPEVLVHMRTGGVSNKSLFNLIRKSREDYAAMRQNGMGGLGTVLRKNFKKIPQFVDKAWVSGELAPAKAPGLE